MLDIQATRFWQVALQSGLLDRPALEACLEAIPPEKRTADAIDRRLARQAISTNKITLWQAQQLLSGRAHGFRIDKYLLLDRIGQGGMGRVYLAKDTRLHRRVALKVLSPDRMNNPRALARFTREAKVGAQLQHDNLVRIYDEGESNGIRYLVMEYIEGRNIGQLIQDTGPLPWPEACRIARQVALGLEHAYQKGLIHRDVNPCNILISPDGVAKLTDLGLAIDLADEENVTRDGATVGTFDYISPEQARHSRSVTTRSDIYSLGCTIYHMISGRVPFPNSSLPEKLFAHQSREPEPLDQVVNDVPESLWLVIRKMLRKRPEERYQTPLAAAQALEPFADPSLGLQAMSEAAASATAPSPTPPPSPEPYEEPADTEPSPAPASAYAPSRSPSPISAATPMIASPVSAVAAMADLPPVTPVTPDPLGAASSFDLGNGMGMGILPLDLGADDPLTAGLLADTRSRSMSRSKSASKSDEAKAATGKAGGRKLVLMAGVAGVVGVLGFAAFLLLIRGNGNPAGAATKGGTVKANTGAKPGVEPKPGNPAPVAEDGGNAGKPAEGITVVYRDGVTRTATSLAEAVTMAGGPRGGEVVLSGKAPVTLNNSTPGIELASGGVTIRAAEGARPILMLDVVGPNPFLSTRGAGRLALKGLRVEARYSSSARSFGHLAEVGGEIDLERCSFVATNAPSTAIAFKVEGLRTRIKNCFFDGFGEALSVALFPQSELTLADTIVAHSGADVKAGWAANLRATTVGPAAPQGAPGRRIRLERCSFQGRGLFQLTGFTDQTPLAVEARHLAVQAEAILAFNAEVAPGAAAPPGFAAIKWAGGDNLYDIKGDAWVAMSTSLLVKAGGLPSDWDAWSAWTKESGSKSEDIQFKTPAGRLGDGPAPADFGLTLPGQKAFGADPGLAGVENG